MGSGDAFFKATFARAKLAKQPQGPLEMLPGLLIVALPLVNNTEIVQDMGLANPIAELVVEVQGPPQVLMGLLTLAL